MSLISGRVSAAVFACVLSAGCGASNLRLQRVVLYQNGIGYFERSGEAAGHTLELRLREHEINDVMKTLTVLGTDGGTVLTAVVPEQTDGPEQERARSAGNDGEDEEDRPAREDSPLQSVHVQLGEAGQVTVSYAVPTPAWSAVHRIVLPQDGEEALLQSWAVVHNASGEDWNDVQLVLATGAPFTYAVDLRTPRFVARPDITGRLVQPVVHGAVLSTESRDDGDRVGDSDQCPTQPEDEDGFQDEDGCPDPDNDGDGILDVDDLCPNDPETYNGMEDRDGCPDRGRVIVEDSSLIILDKIYFDSRSRTIPTRATPVLDTIIAAVLANPQITHMTVSGHAARNERGANRLSRARAQAIVDAMVRAGVERSRLSVRGLGSTQPINPGSNADAYANNRRVEFEIDGSESEGAPDAPAAARSQAPVRPRPIADTSRPAVISAASQDRPAAATVVTDDGSSSTRYVLDSPVTIPAGSSTLVAVVNERVPGSEVLLYRPDRGTPLSGQHPYRAARIENRTSVSLVQGPLALFARGTFVGEGVLNVLNAGKNTLVPFALDRSTQIRVVTGTSREPYRLVHLERGEMTVEDWSLRTTTYEIRPGARTPTRLILQHTLQRGYEPMDLPPETEMSGRAALIPITVVPNAPSRFEVVERRGTRRSLSLINTTENLSAYLSEVPADFHDAFEAVLQQRTSLREIDAQLADLRRQQSVQSRRLSELQRSLTSIERSGPSAAGLRRDLQHALAEATTASEHLTVQEASLAGQRAEARVRLAEAIRTLHFGASPR